MTDRYKSGANETQPIAYAPAPVQPVVAYPPPPPGQAYVQPVPGAYQVPYGVPYGVPQQPVGTAGEVQMLPRPGTYLFDVNEYSIHLQPFVEKHVIQEALQHFNAAVTQATKIPLLMTKIAVVLLLLSFFAFLILSISWAFIWYYWYFPAFGSLIFIIAIFGLSFSLVFTRAALVNKLNKAVDSLQPYVDSLNHRYNANGVRFRLSTENAFAGYGRYNRATYRLVPKFVIEFNAALRAVS